MSGILSKIMMKRKWDGKQFVLVGARGNLGPIWRKTILKNGGSILTLDPPQFDVLCSDSWKRMNLPSRIDVLLYNAAIDNPPKSKASFFDNCGIIVNVNLVGAARMTEHAVSIMQRQGGGTIIYVGSIMGNVGADWRNYDEGFEKPVGYNISKAGLIQLARSVTTQYGRYGIRACVMAFGPYDNGQLPVTFKNKFLRNVPLKRTISKTSLIATLEYLVDCPEIAGQQVLVDAGYTAW